MAVLLCPEIVINDFPDKIGWRGSITGHLFTSLQDN
jgi:hypothetical protein